MKVRLLSGVLSAALIMVGGCGGTQYTSPSTPSPTPAPSGSGSGSATTIAIVGNQGSQSFNPNPASAETAVSWRNADGVAHHLVANDGSFDTGIIAPGATSAAVALKTDGANYHCTIHPGMVGSIKSSAGTAPPCSGVYCSSVR